MSYDTEDTALKLQIDSEVRAMDAMPVVNTLSQYAAPRTRASRLGLALVSGVTNVVSMVAAVKRGSRHLSASRRAAQHC